MTPMDMEFALKRVSVHLDILPQIDKRANSLPLMHCAHTDEPFPGGLETLHSRGQKSYTGTSPKGLWQLAVLSMTFMLAFPIVLITLPSLAEEVTLKVSYLGQASEPRCSVCIHCSTCCQSNQCSTMTEGEENRFLQSAK